MKLYAKLKSALLWEFYFVLSVTAHINAIYNIKEKFIMVLIIIIWALK